MGLWTVEPVPSGVRLTHSCGQYRSFHQGEWVGLMMEVMQKHECPTPDPRLGDNDGAR